MINPYTIPSFAGMLLFTVLGTYLLTRSPRSPISLTAAGAQAGMAAYLFGAGMADNAPTRDDFVRWTQQLHWGATLAPTLWYWLTLLLLRDQPFPSAQRYVRWVGYPVGGVVSMLGVVATLGIYVDGGLYQWSQVAALTGPTARFAGFNLPHGPYYFLLAVLILGATAMATVNITLAWRLSLDPARRRCFWWLLMSALLILVGANSLAIVNMVFDSIVPTWFGQVILIAAMVAMAWNVAAYGLLFSGEVIRRDFFYVLTASILTCMVYFLVFVASGISFTFELLGVLFVTLALVIISHALFDVGRQILDRLFFTDEVQQLRANLASTIQSAALTEDLTALIAETQNQMSELSTQHTARLTEIALRNLNKPATLANCELALIIPSVLAARRLSTAQPTPLELARTLREVLTDGIERLKPLDGDGMEAPAALQYHILREEYLSDMLNKQIMARHAISEGTFHRNRRQAIAALARELETLERGTSRAPTPLG